jgi:4-hydroxybenzoate polyprenyltransferase
MGAPLIAMLLTLPELNVVNGMRVIHALGAFFFLWAHLYTLNEWAVYSFDRHDTSKRITPMLAGEIAPREVLLLSIFFALICIILYAFLNIRFLIIVFLDILIGILYAHPRILLKSVPFASFAILFTVSVLDFLLGWFVFSSSIHKGLLIGIFFGMLGIVGQHYHEAGDYDSDKRVGIKTNAVRYGRKKIFILGFFLYALSCLYFCILTFFYILQGYLYLTLVLSYPVYLFIFYKCIRTNMRSSGIHLFVKRYRILYGLIGAAMICILVFA